MEPALHQIGSPSRKAMLCWLRQIISGIFGPWVELLVIPGVDGIIQSVEVLVKGKVLIKTIEKLVPLEADIHDLGKGYRPELAEDFLDDDDDGSSAGDTDS